MLLVLAALWHAQGGANRLRAVRLVPPDARLFVATGMVLENRIFAVADQRPYALCVGVWQPVIYVSTDMLASAGIDELRAAVAHEEAHRRRRDPLRTVLAALLARQVRRVPWWSSIAERMQLRAEVAADQFARQHGSTPALAESLLRVVRNGLEQHGSILEHPH